MPKDSRQRALALIQKYGWNSTSFQVLEPFFEYWFNEDETGVVAYYEAWGTWVVAGAPICPHDQLVEFALKFVEAANNAGFRVCFFGTAARFAEQMNAHATHVKIGEQPCWNPGRWDSDSKRMKLIGSQRRRAERKGVTVTQINSRLMSQRNSPERQQAEAVIAQWQRMQKMATMSFVVHLDAFSFASERRYFLAQRQNELGQAEAVGFLSLVPIYARDGFFLEDLIRTPSAPNGTTEALIDAAMRSLAVEGKSFATLGLSPLRNITQSHYQQPLWARTIFSVSRRLFDPLYSFEGLAAFKAKLRPDMWEEVYVTGIPKFNFNMLIAVLMAFMRSHPTRFAFDTFARLVTMNLRLVKRNTWRRLSYSLAIALVAWIGILSQCNGEFWFGSQATLRNWILFDCVMVVVLVHLGYKVLSPGKFYRGLLYIALTAVIADFSLTAWQALRFFNAHSQSYVQILAWLIALSGPTIASLVFAGMAIALHAHRRRVPKRN